MGCSKLKAHLHFELHVEDSPHCACDQVNEDPYHYFFVCPFYKVQRVQMMNDLSQYITGIPRLSHILYGNDALSETYITNIFSLLSINSLRILKDLKINYNTNLAIQCCTFFFFVIVFVLIYCIL